MKRLHRMSVLSAAACYAGGRAGTRCSCGRCWGVNSRAHAAALCCTTAWHMIGARRRALHAPLCTLPYASGKLQQRCRVGVFVCRAPCFLLCVILGGSSVGCRSRCALRCALCPSVFYNRGAAFSHCIVLSVLLFCWPSRCSCRVFVATHGLFPDGCSQHQAASTPRAVPPKWGCDATKARGLGHQNGAATRHQHEGDKSRESSC